MHLLLVQFRTRIHIIFDVFCSRTMPNKRCTLFLIFEVAHGSFFQAQSWGRLWILSQAPHRCSKLSSRDRRWAGFATVAQNAGGRERSLAGKSDDAAKTAPRNSRAVEVGSKASPRPNGKPVHGVPSVYPTFLVENSKCLNIVCCKSSLALVHVVNERCEYFFLNRKVLKKLEKRFQKIYGAVPIFRRGPKDIPSDRRPRGRTDRGADQGHWKTQRATCIFQLGMINFYDHIVFLAKTQARNFYRNIQYMHSLHQNISRSYSLFERYLFGYFSWDSSTISWSWDWQPLNFEAEKLFKFQQWAECLFLKSILRMQTPSM